MSTLIFEIFQIFCILYFISIFYTFKTILFILHFLFSCAFLLLRFICFRHQMHKNSPHSIQFESCGEFNRARQIPCWVTLSNKQRVGTCLYHKYLLTMKVLSKQRSGLRISASFYSFVFSLINCSFVLEYMIFWL